MASQGPTSNRSMAGHSGWQHSNGGIPNLVPSITTSKTVNWSSRPRPEPMKNNIDAARGNALAAWEDSNVHPPATKRSESGLEHHQSRQLSAYRRWLNRNKISQTQTSPSDGDQDGPLKLRSRYTTKYRETLGASVLLYMGLGMMAVGVVITVVGVGDANFHTLGLRLIGPVLAGLGLVLCIIRVAVCACASKCSLCDRPVAELTREKSTINIRTWRPITAVMVEGPTAPNGRGFPPPTPIRRPPTPARVTLQGSDDGPRAINEDDTLSQSSFQDSIPMDPVDDQDGLGGLSSDDSFSLSEFQEIELQPSKPSIDEVRPPKLRLDDVKTSSSLGTGVVLQAKGLQDKTTTFDQDME